LRVLITGSLGFVGSSVGQFASRAGHEVLGIGRGAGHDATWLSRYVKADVTSDDLSGVIREFAPDLLFHAAGSASVGDSLRQPLEDFRAAALTWANILDCVRRSERTPTIIFPSSAAIYGNPTRLPVSEETSVRPISPYGFHKAACELLAREYAECFGLNIVVCRFFSVLGPLQRRLLVWELYKQLAGTDSSVWLQGTGTESRDYLHVDDVAAALLQLATGQGPERERGSYLVMNVASGEETSVLELARQMRALVAPKKEICCRGIERPGDPYRWCADITRLRSLAPGWRPRPFGEGLAQCIATWREEGA
jgi:UDP-glucose 4-epimerase